MTPDTDVDDSLEYQFAIDLPGRNASRRGRPVTSSQAIVASPKSHLPNRKQHPLRRTWTILCDVVVHVRTALRRLNLAFQKAGFVTILGRIICDLRSAADNVRTPESFIAGSGRKDDPNQ